MKLWMSSEAQADVDEIYSSVRKEIETALNKQLSSVSLDTKFEEWAFIAIIRKQDHPDYPELSKKHLRRKVLEFRLKIDHSKFLSASDAERRKMVINALRRCVFLMSDLGISGEDSQKLNALLQAIEQN